MKIKFLVDEDIANYKKCSMFIGASSCTFKCMKECKRAICQNSSLASAPIIHISIDEIIDRYLDNLLTSAVVIGGLEPFDQWEELQSFIVNFRYRSPDDIVIYTGYTEEELKDKTEWLKLYGPIIVKFGRFVPDQEPHYDEVLGVNLTSNNQYAKEFI